MYSHLNLFHPGGDLSLHFPSLVDMFGKSVVFILKIGRFVFILKIVGCCFYFKNSRLFLFLKSPRGYKKFIHSFPLASTMSFSQTRALLQAKQEEQLMQMARGQLVLTKEERLRLFSINFLYTCFNVEVNDKSETLF